MIYVSAGGNGSRIRNQLSEAGFENVPKHLLDAYPFSNLESKPLVQLNTETALATGDDVTVLANAENEPLIRRSLSGYDCSVDILTGNGSLGPFSFTKGAQPGETRYSVAGDIYIEDLDWEGFKESHEKMARPVTFLVGKAAAKKSGAVFGLNPYDNTIESFYRSEQGEEIVTRNIGVYAFTLNEQVTNILRQHRAKKVEQTDNIAQDLIDSRCVQAVSHLGVFFNINDIDDYLELVEHTRQF